MALPIFQDPFPGTKKTTPRRVVHPTPTPPPHQREGGGCGVTTGREGEGPGLPTLTPAVPCSRRDSCNPLCRGETEASLLSQDSCLS